MSSTRRRVRIVYILWMINSVGKMSLRVFMSDSELVYAAPTGGEPPHLGELFVLRGSDRSVLLKVVGHGYVSTIRNELLAMMSRDLG